jgi:para-aminobenzoate synthetase component 1
MNMVSKFSVTNFNSTREQLLIWGSHFSSCCFLDNNQYESPWKQQECVLAAGALHKVNPGTGNAINHLQNFIDHHKGEWIFGHLAYHLKDEIENGTAPCENPDGFESMHFFVPETVIQLCATAVTISSGHIEPAIIWEAICSIKVPMHAHPNVAEPEPAISKDQYIETIKKLKEHIHRGDCYEINFCQEFLAKNAIVNPVQLYRQLNRVSPNPFCCYYKIEDAHLMCASPERYLMRKGNTLFSQPIKGTASRNFENESADAAKKVALKDDPKERSENVMIVDLVRNDLSKICKEGSVKVDELFEVYTYPHVHQMISTVSGEVRDTTSFTDIICATFPMGSMTGAPKKRVMELIDQYESGSRGIFSGAVGYISPAGDFDFNVVIRSLMYNNKKRYLSYWVGGGITWYSRTEQEYEECMLKAAAIKKVLAGSDRL